jgi:hypothetical protein
MNHEYRVKWQACPRVQNPSRVMFLWAENANMAHARATDRIEREHGITWFIIDDVSEASQINRPTT